MGKTHLEQIELAKQLEAAKTKIEIGAQYCHYKGADKIYKVLGLGFLEENNELCVIYQAEYDERLTFLRPLKIWLQTVEWNGRAVPRFKRV